MNTPIHDQLLAESERTPRWRRDELAALLAVLLVVASFVTFVAVTR